MSLKTLNICKGQAVLFMVLTVSLLFYGCGGNNAASEDKTNIQPTAECPCGQEAAVADKAAESPAFGITLWEGRSDALVNGSSVTLPEAPFVENDVFYFPLQFVSESLGFAYSYEDGFASIALSGHQTQYEINSRRVMIDGVSYQASGNHYLFRMNRPYREADDTFVPVVKNNVVFLPVGYQVSEHVSYFNYFDIQQFPEAGMVVINGSEQEDGIAGFYLRENYDELPGVLRDTMEYSGVVGQARDWYDVVEYRRDGLFVHVLRLPEGREDIDGIDGVIGSVCVTNSDFPTPRGLRCGDSGKRAWELYGYDFAQSFSYELENDLIVRMGFYAYFDTTFGFEQLYMDGVPEWYLS